MTKISESEIIRNKNGIEHGTAQCSMHNRNNVNQMGKHTGRGEILHRNWNIFFVFVGFKKLPFRQTITGPRFTKLKMSKEQQSTK